MKTNAARLLDGLAIPYELRDYEVDPEDLSAETVAAKIGLPSAQVWKTLVVRGARTGVSMAVVAAGTQLDLKALARALGDRNVETVALKDVLPLTGFVRGGVTAIGGKRKYRVVVDEAINLYDVVSVSAGVRGTQILLAPADYLRAIDGTLAPIAVASAVGKA